MHAWGPWGAGSPALSPRPTSVLSHARDPPSNSSKLPPFQARECGVTKRLPSPLPRRAAPSLDPAPLLRAPTVPGPGSYLSTHSLRKRISSVCRTLGSCLHIFTKARSSFTLRGSMVGTPRATAMEVAALSKARKLAGRDLAEGGGCREVEPTRTSQAAGSAPQRPRDPGSFACSLLPYLCSSTLAGIF